MFVKFLVTILVRDICPNDHIRIPLLLSEGRNSSKNIEIVQKSTKSVSILEIVSSPGEIISQDLPRILPKDLGKSSSNPGKILPNIFPDIFRTFVKFMQWIHTWVAERKQRRRKLKIHGSVRVRGCFKSFSILARSDHFALYGVCPYRTRFILGCQLVSLGVIFDDIIAGVYTIFVLTIIFFFIGG